MISADHTDRVDYTLRLCNMKQEKINEILNKFQDDPTYHLEWSAEKVSIDREIKRIKNTVETMRGHGHNDEAIVGQLVRDGLRVVFGSLPTSTNAVANIMGIYQRDFWIQILELLGVSQYSICDQMFPKPRAE